MKRPYTKIYDMLWDFQDSEDFVRKIDTSNWSSNKIACDCLRRTIKLRGFKGISVSQCGDEIFLKKRSKDVVFVKIGEGKEKHKMKLKVKLDRGATMPTRAHATDAGLDLYAAEDVNIWPQSWQAVETGVHVAIPEGYVGLLTSKSGLMRSKGLTCRGTIDAGYTGTIQAVLFNHSDVHIRIPKGNKVTQLVILPIITPEVELVDYLDETERGNGGFGSTGER